MRAKIRAERAAGREPLTQGYVMVAHTPTGVEYPQEGRVHPTKQSVYADARGMYDNATWAWRERDKSIIV